MEISAGLVIINDNKILLVHPTGAKWYGTYSIPKGHIESGELVLDAAIRETSEEIGITFNYNELNILNNGVIDYDNKQTGEIYKKVFYYVIDNVIDINNLKLQLDEVNWAGFLTKDEAYKRIHRRFRILIEKYLK